MKIKNLLIFSVAALLLAGCTTSNAGGDAKANEGGESSGEQQGEQFVVEDGDYYKADSFEADDQAYASMVETFKKPSVRFIGDEYQISLVYDSSYYKNKMVIYGSYEVSGSNITLNMEGYRMNSVEQGSSMPYVFSLSVHSGNLRLKMSATQVVEGQTMTINLAHADLTKSEFAITHTVNGQYHFVGFENISPYSMTDADIEQATTYYSISELYFADSQVKFTALNGPDHIYQYECTIVNSNLRLDRVVYYDFDGERLYSYTVSNVNYSYSVIENEFKLSTTGKFWVCYSK